MITKDLVVTCPSGLHARPATLLVKKASSFKSSVFVEHKGKKANAKSLIGVLSLGASKGAEIKLMVEGDDEVHAAEELEKLIVNMDE